MLSRKTVGTVSNTSRMTEEMKGSTMIARMNPAVSTPIPSGGPANNRPIPGMLPRVLISAGSIYSWTKGASTKRPQIP